MVLRIMLLDIGLLNVKGSDDGIFQMYYCESS
jgi:hypothetical protein